MKNILFIFCVVFTFGCKSNKTQLVNTKPNIILILADDLGYETIGVYGNQGYETPNIDKLAEEGMRFDHCYSTPLCTPSRVQIMTGKYSFRNYIGFGLLDPNEKTFAHHLSKEGYKNLVVGKWQLFGSDYQQQLAGGKIGTMPDQAGFHDYCLWQVDTLGSRYKNPTLSIKANGGEARKYQGYGPDIFVDYATDFIEKNKQSPFFVYYPMVLTHDPFVPTPDNVEYNLYNKGNNPAYFGSMVRYMDKLVGKLVQKLEDEGIRENTLILFVGDNGTHKEIVSILNGEQVQGNKGTTLNGGTHVPFIANWKGTISQGGVNKNLIDFTDFLPTMLKAVNVSTEGVKTDGVEFYSQLIGQPSKPREWIFCHYEPNWSSFKKRRYVQDTLIKLYDNGELYNISRDKEEQHPLIKKKQSLVIQERVKRFKDILKEYQ